MRSAGFALLLCVAMFVPASLFAQSDSAKTANEVRVAREMYGKSAHTKKSKKKHMDLYQDFYTVGISYDMPFDGSNAPYKKGASLSVYGNYMLSGNKISLGYAANIGLLFSQNIDWFSRVFKITPTEVANSGSSIGQAYTLSFVAQAVLVNKQHYAFTVAPEVGLAINYLPQPITTDTTETPTLSNRNLFRINYGARLNAYLGYHTNLFIGYNTSGVKSVEVTRNTTTLSYPVTDAVLRIGVALRLGDGDWW